MEKNKEYISYENLYMVIPTLVGIDKELPFGARVLYGLISSLSHKEGYCWATNAYFADILGVSKSSISNWISLLQKKGYITSDIIYKKGTREIESRHIKVNLVISVSNMVKTEKKEDSKPDLSENIKPLSELSQIPMRTDCEDINIYYKYNNNNNINTLCEQVHREEEKTPGKQSKTKKEKYTEQDKELALYLKAKLEERGATVFPRDWLMKNYATAHRLLKTVSLDELKSCIDWLLEDNYWQSRVDSLIVVEKKIAQFQMQNNGKIGKSPYDDLF